MKRILSLGAVSFVALALVPQAQAQCDTWKQLGTLGYAGYSPLHEHRLVEASHDKIVVGSDCYCGYHGFVIPAVLHWGGIWWNDTAPMTKTGRLEGIDMLDAGSGPRLHIFGHGSDLGVYFLKTEGIGWVPATAISPGRLTAAAVFDDGSGPTYFVARQTGGILRWSGTAWTDVTPSGGPPPVVSELHVHDDGSGPALYAAGSFQSLDGAPANAVARWNGTSWSAVGSGMTSPGGSGLRVNHLRTIQDGSGLALYAGGLFELADGQPANGLARWDGTSWTGLGAGLPAAAEVAGIEWFDDGHGNGAALVVKLDVPLDLVRLDAGVWSSIALPSNMPLRTGSLGQVRFPSDPGPSLVTRVRHTNGFEFTFAALQGCELTGTLSCFGDGSAAACPCGNDSAPAERAGCLNSLGTGGALRARGDPSLSHDTIVLEGTGMNSSAVLYFQGASSHAPAPFGDGLKCVGGPFVRLSTKINVAGASSYPTAGDSALSLKGHLPGPCTRHYQARYRNAAASCTSDTFNYTNAVSLVWQP